MSEEAMQAVLDLLAKIGSACMGLSALQVLPRNAARDRRRHGLQPRINQPLLGGLEGGANDCSAQRRARKPLFR